MWQLSESGQRTRGCRFNEPAGNKNNDFRLLPNLVSVSGDCFCPPQRGFRRSSLHSNSLCVARNREKPRKISAVRLAVGLREESLHEEVTAVAIKRVLVLQIEAARSDSCLSKYLERAVTAIRRNGQNCRQTILTETARPSLHFTVDSPCARMTLVNVRGRTVLVPCRD